MLQRVRGQVIAALVVGLGIGAIVWTTTGGSPPSGSPTEANIYVVTGGGTCTGGASTTPVAYADSASPDRRCGSFDQAWDQMNCTGSPMIAIIKTGTYGRQFITGDKTCTTKLIGESKPDVLITGTTDDCRPAFGSSTLLCPDGDNIWIENVTVDTNTEDGPSPGTMVAGQNVTYKNVDILGHWPDISVGNTQPECVGCNAAGFTWDGGTFGYVNPLKRPCGADPGGNGEPVWIYFPNVTIKNIIFNKQWVELEIGSGGTCAPNDNAHLEFIRLESGANNTTILNNTFMPESESGSGYIFSSASPTGTRIIGNFFADNSGSTWAQLGGLPCGVIVAYNYFSPGPLPDGAIFTCSPTWVGNYGVNQGTGGTHVKNVFSGSGSTGSNTYIGAADHLIDSTGHISSGAPAIDAAESTGSSIIFPSQVPAVDFDGDPRPCGAAYDAGPDERC